MNPPPRRQQIVSILMMLAMLVFLLATTRRCSQDVAHLVQSFDNGAAGAPGDGGARPLQGGGSRDGG